jgi:hypothetical protein
MRMPTWILGLLFGFFVAAAFLLAGGIALILLVPALAWAALDRLRPTALAGVLLGTGLGAAGLITLSQANCLRFNAASGGGLIQSCTGPDLTWYYAVAFVFALVGVALTFAARHTAPR